MGKASTSWLLPRHSGSPCRHDAIYTKTNKKTGAVYTVKLCNPNKTVSTDQATQRSEFGKISNALSVWINANKLSTASDHAIYQGVKAQYDRQIKYSTIRGYMMAKGMATVQSDGSVIITIGTYSKSVINGVLSGTGGGGTSY